MQSLCLNVEVLSTTGEEIEMRELDEDVFRTAEELGIDLSRPERGRTRRTPGGRPSDRVACDVGPASGSCPSGSLPGGALRRRGPLPTGHPSASSVPVLVVLRVF